MATQKSLIELLPDVVKQGKKEVEKILERLESGNRMTLQTNEYNQLWIMNYELKITK